MARLVRIDIFPLAAVFACDAMPEGVAGDARGPVIRIGAKQWDRGDQGLLQHELEHVRQFWRMWLLGAIVNAPLAVWLALQFGSPLMPLQAGIAVGVACMAMHPGLYLFSRAYREFAEVAAYRVQMQYPDGRGGQLSWMDAAERLCMPRYGLKLTLVEVARLLR